MRKLLISLFVIGLATTAFAAERIKIRKFAGLNTRLSEYEIKTEESPSMSNFHLDIAGVLTERDLFKYYNTTSIGTVPITNVYKFYKSSDAGYLVCAGGTELYKASAGALTDICTSTTVTSGSHWSFETFTDGTNEFVFAANNGTRLLSWNGTGDNFYDRGAVPAENCNLLKKHKARLFAAGSIEYPYRLYYSSLSDGSDFATTGGTIDLPSYERIMALEVLADVLYILTRTSIYALVGDTPNEFVLLLTRSTVGTHATKSVVLGNKVILFLNKAGVFAFSGDDSVNISETIQPTIEAISNTYISEAAGLYDTRGKYWLAYTSTNGTYNDRILVYDTIIKQWYELTGVFASFFKATGGKDKGELYAGCSDNIGYLWQLQVAAALEQLVHSSQTQLETGVTFNTVFDGSETAPLVPLQYDGDYLDAELIVHCDGTNGSTSFNDFSPVEHSAASTFGTAHVNTATKKFGTGSLYVDGINDYITFADSASWDLVASKTDDWTIDLWVKHTDHIGEEVYMSQGEVGVGDWGFVNNSNTTTLTFKVQIGGGLNELDLITTDIRDTDWHCLTVIKVADEWGLYVDGHQKAYDTTTDLMTLAGPLVLGANYNFTQDFDGYIDEVRIYHSNIYKTFPVAAKTDEFVTTDSVFATSGTLTSDFLQINAADQAALGAITWNESLGTDTDIQFTTRTGTTDDTTYDTWTEAWVSTSTALLEVTDAATWTNWGYITVSGTTAQARDITYYEIDDSVSPNAVKITVYGADSTDDWVEVSSDCVDISGKKFVGFWLKSDITGNAVKLDMGEISGTSIGHITPHTVEVGVWEYHYWPLSSYTSTDLDKVGWIRVTYLEDKTGDIYLGDIYAYDFFDSGETITSTPNDWIQYKAILGTSDWDFTPQLIETNEVVISISYSGGVGTAESSLLSSWGSKAFDLKRPDVKKYWQWAELDLEQTGTVTFSSVSMGWDVDDGRQTGCVEKDFDVTGRRVKMRYYFPSGTYGDSITLTVTNSTVDDNIKINQLTISGIPEGGT